MFLELNEYWQELSEARVTKSIHPVWKQRRLSSFMNTRYTHTMLHRLALGRGPLRGIVHRRHDETLQKCRYGCDEIENAEHVVMYCKRTKGKREIIKKRCAEMKIEFTMKSLFCEIKLQHDMEILLNKFIKN